MSLPNDRQRFRNSPVIMIPAVGQTVSEYMRLEHVLAGYVTDMNEETRDEVRLRLDIMLGRLELLQQGNLRSFIQNDQRRRDLF